MSNDKPSEAELRARSILLPGSALQKDYPEDAAPAAINRATVTFSAEDVYKDVLGLVTGIPKSYYIKLSSTPTSVRSVLVDYLNYTASCAIAKNKRGENTPYIILPSSYYPFTEVEVMYDYKPELGPKEKAIVKT